jgi:hypothetical protein
MRFGEQISETVREQFELLRADHAAPCPRQVAGRLVLGTSRVLGVSTTTTIAILTAAQLGQVVPNGNTARMHQR